MATGSQWMQAARPKTLPASLAPVIMGIGGALGLGSASVGKSALALLVALFFQIGVNFSNDYSDGIRGTDAKEKRVGPQRLTGAGLAAPRTVLAAALSCYAFAGICGIALCVWAGSYVLIGLGVLAALAAWFYTGGKHPYGYLPGVAEVMVFAFFGLLAVQGTIWVQAHTLPGRTWIASSGIGLLSCALLLVNNLRDIPGDQQSGKNTLAVKLGDKGSRYLFVFYLYAALVLGILSFKVRWVALVFGLAMAIWVCFPMLKVLQGARGKVLIQTLKQVGQITLGYGIAIAVGWAFQGL
ncbi:1,4-dihydroxy-2-naphthoate polyprenyltransferase [Varibaculum vaginae]|uniref:1,4-dihydroxy-2-naphthoate polyprenyltransferase n=1 Tax=Varibaculum vaginae TaxID=2364797 RepID=UPI000F07402B|nr:1,4-dihydroxy-2-naphthoate polyprenyltransferase [Varibaculum vaginae]